MDDYKLSEVLDGHKLDVRCICASPSVPEIGKISFNKNFKKYCVIRPDYTYPIF